MILMLARKPDSNPPREKNRETQSYILWEKALFGGNCSSMFFFFFRIKQIIRHGVLLLHTGAGSWIVGWEVGHPHPEHHRHQGELVDFPWPDYWRDLEAISSFIFFIFF
jgi:hypothetical protein